MQVFLAIREVPRRFLGTRVEPKYEAELREVVNNCYESRARVFRKTKLTVSEAAHAFAKRKKWTIAGAIGWAVRVVDPERRSFVATRTPQVDRGLVAIVDIVASGADRLWDDGPPNIEDINAALDWIKKTTVRS